MKQEIKYDEIIDFLRILYTAKRRMNMIEIRAEELEEFFPLETDDTALPVDILVDNYAAYEIGKHPLWLYFRNGYGNNGEFVRLTIDKKEPHILDSFKPRIFMDDIVALKDFVVRNFNSFGSLANDRMGIIRFVETFRRINEDGRPIVTEMATLSRTDTGLPGKIWLGNISAMDQTGHGERIKFQVPKNDNVSTRWAGLTIPDYKIVSKGRVDWSANELEILKRFVKANEDVLLDAMKNSLPRYKFVYKLKRIDSRGNLLPPVEDCRYYPINAPVRGFQMVRDKDGLKNFVDSEGNLISGIWFDNAQPFIVNYGGTKTAYVEKDGNYYWLYADGTIAKIGSNGE